MQWTAAERARRQRRAGRFAGKDRQGGGGGGGTSTAWRSEERRQRMLALMEEMEADEEVDWDALAIKVWWVCVGGGMPGGSTALSFCPSCHAFVQPTHRIS